MSKTPLISVVLPSYNHANFVTRAIETVLQQTIGDIELIVVDDGSTDGTPNVIEKIKDERLQLIRLGQNRQRHPRNLALGMARGHYVAFQNSDDEWLPDKLQKQLEILEQQKKVVACFTDVTLIDEKNQAVASSWASQLFTTQNRTNLEWLKRFFTAGNCLCITSALVRRAAIEHAGRFRGNLIQTADFELWVRLAAENDFHIIDEKLTLMRIVGGKGNAPVQEFAPTSPFLRKLPAPLQQWIKQKANPKPVVTNDDGHIVTSSNLSAPGINATNRLIFEFASIFKSFAQAPILDLIPRIFQEIPDVGVSRTVRQTSLAKYAWSLNSPSHALFADQLIESIMENDAARNEMTDQFGGEIVHEFLQRRGKLSLQMMQNGG